MPTGSPCLPSLSSRPRATDGARSTRTFLFSTRVATFMASRTSCTRRRAGLGMDWRARSVSISVVLDDDVGIGVGAAGEDVARLALGFAQAVRLAHDDGTRLLLHLAGAAATHGATEGEVDAGLEPGLQQRLARARGH